MALQQVEYKIKGMSQDYAQSIHNPEFSFENKNIRLTSKENNSLLAIENEKGNSKYDLYDYQDLEQTVLIQGTCLGSAVINDTVVLFIHNQYVNVDKDYIYIVYDFDKINKKATLELLYRGNLNLSTRIETLISYENENIQKVYWIDKINPPRVINIKGDKTRYNNNDYFNFIPKLNLTEKVTVLKQNSGGQFPAGTVQYAFTYFNKFGQETNIFYTTPLLYSTNVNRGGAINEIVTNSFNISIENIDTNFDYLRIYSIIRTSINSTPILKHITDINTQDIQTKVNYTDTFTATFEGTVYGPEVFTINTFGSVISSPAVVSDVLNATFYKKYVEGDLVLLQYDESYPSLYHLDGSPATFEYGESLICVGVNSKIGLNSTTGEFSFIIGVGAYNDCNAIEIKIFDTLPIQANFTTYTELPNTPWVLELNTISPVEIYKSNFSSSHTTSILGNTYTITYDTLNIHTTPNNQSTKFTKIFSNGVKQQLLTLSGLYLNNNEQLLMEGQITVADSYGINFMSYFGQCIIHCKDLQHNLVGDDSSYGQLILQGITETYGVASIITYSNMEYVNSVNYTDTNLYGESIDSTKLLYIGGQEIIPKTIAQKDNTLFLGNITLKKGLISNIPLTYVPNVVFTEKLLYVENSNRVKYGYIPESLNKLQQKTFKHGDKYRFGVQGQSKTGEWSDVKFIKDAVNNIKPVTQLESSNKVTVKGSKATITISDTAFLTNLYNEDYIKLRGVVVYPKEEERLIIAQGVVNPTLIHVGDKGNNNIDNYSSWFFRPTLTVTPTMSGFSTDLNTNYHEYRHHKSIPGFNNVLNNIGIAAPNSEIISNQGLPEYPSARGTGGQFVSTYTNNFYIDNSIVTLHSPDIEFNEVIQGLDGEQFKFRIIGMAGIHAFNFDYKLSAGNPFNGQGDTHTSFTSKSNYSYAANSYGMLPIWKDEIEGGTGGEKVNYMIYPWHSERSLMNQSSSATNKVALLKNKQMSYFRYSGYNTYFDSNWEPSNNVTNLGIYNKDNKNIVKIDSTYNGRDKLIYTGTIDKLVGINKDIISTYKGYPFIITKSSNPYGNSRVGAGNQTGSEFPRIQYNSTTHGVIGFKWKYYDAESSDRQIILPVINTSNIHQLTNYAPFYDDQNLSFFSTEVVKKSNGSNYDIGSNGGMFIAELYRDEPQNMFGGNTDYAYQNNTWIVCGEPVNLRESNGSMKSSVTIEYTEGDTYVQRYDCLKTFSESLEQINSVTDTFSFLVETRINLDGRYDRNRGNISNIGATPSTFNVLNSVYNQTDNYFTYSALDPDRFAINKFPNTFTYTKQKLAGDIVDTWTNITMSSTYDVNGELGEITAIKLFNDQLIGFQNKGIFQIMFNSRVQLNANDGLPVELANSGKVDSVRYFSTNVGSSFSNAINVTPNGIYFINDEYKSINMFNGQVNVLSDSLGFRTWLLNNYSKEDPFYILYNSTNKDVYFITSQYALCYSELLQTFTSFYSYENVKDLWNLNNSTFTIGKDTLSNPQNIHIWEQNTGQYGKFFNTNKEFYVKYLVNPNPTLDKVFNTVSFIGDVFNSTTMLTGIRPIDTINVKTEYQEGTELLDVTTNLKQKFRVWRAQLPRTTSITSDIFMANPNKLIGMDRIRNPWAFITLYRNTDLSNNRVVIQNTTFHYSL